MASHFNNPDLSSITSFRVMELLAQAKQLEADGVKVIHMEVGEPRFPIAEPILDAAQQALVNDDMGYTEATGSSALKQTLADFYRERYDVNVEPSRIVITTGGSGALLLLSHLLIQPGDGVLLSDPGYPCNSNFVRLVGGEAQLIPVGEESNYQLSGTAVAQAWRENTRGVILASPSNPTGELLCRRQLSDIYQSVAERQGFVLVDEIYHGLTYGEKAVSALEVSDDVFVVNSFSKFFGMTGMRLGWMVVPQACVATVDKLAQNLFIAPPTLSQRAALSVFEPITMKILERRRDLFQQRRDFLLPALRDLGFSIPHEPAGAFYLYAGIQSFLERGIATDSEAFCARLLQEEAIAITPGTDFGEYGAAEHVRFAYTADIDDLKIAVDKMSRFLNK